MKLWVDDLRPVPDGDDWVEVNSVNDAIEEILYRERMLTTCKEWIELKTSLGMDPSNWEWHLKMHTIELIDIDHDAGDFANYGGDYIRLLDWLEETGRNYPIRIHSMNVVGVQNMRTIIRRNGWKEVI